MILFFVVSDYLLPEAMNSLYHMNYASAGENFDISIVILLISLIVILLLVIPENLITTKTILLSILWFRSLSVFTANTFNGKVHYIYGTDLWFFVMAVLGTILKLNEKA